MPSLELPSKLNPRQLMFLKDKYESIKKCFGYSLELFKQVDGFEDLQVCNKIFGQAKVLLAETEFFINFSDFLPYDQEVLDHYF